MSFKLVVISSCLLLVLFLLSLATAARNYEARNVRLSKSTNQLFISWTTTDYHSDEFSPTVWLSQNADFSDYSENLNKVSVPITKSHHNESAGYTHTVTLDKSLQELASNALYYYRVGNAKNKQMSKRLYPLRVKLSNKVLLYGDMGIFRSSRTIKSVEQRLQTDHNISMVYHLGDISYADDFPGTLFDSLFSHWLGLVEGITSFVPYQVLPGNHDAGCKIPFCHAWKQDFRPYNFLFTMPSYLQLKHNMFYSFDHGQIHFVSISTETDYDGAPFKQTFGDQMTWLRKDLETAVANRRRAPWIVVLGHRPVYSSMMGYSSKGKPTGQSLVIQNTFEQLLKDYRVDLYMVGHVHSYERFHPVFRNEPQCDTTCTNSTNVYHNPESTVHVVNGAAGCEEGLSPSVKYLSILPASAKVFNKDYGYGVLETSTQGNQLMMNWKFYSASKDVVEDEMTIIKNTI